VNNDDPRFWQLLAVAAIVLAIAFLCGAVASIIAAAQNGREFWSGWLPHVLRLIAVLGFAVFTYVVVRWVWICLDASIQVMNNSVATRIVDMHHSILERIANMETRYQAQIERIRRQTSPMIAGLLLLGQALVSVTDKGIVGADSPKVRIVVALVLIIWFSVANWKLTDDSKAWRVFGYIWWFLGVIGVVWIYAFYYQKGIPDLLDFLLKMESAISIFIWMSILILLLLPMLFRQRKKTL
jgi:hypothetical protein